MMINLVLLIQEVVKAFPQEWASLVPVVEFLMHAAPQGAHGISAHDLTCSFSIATRTDARLAPFRVPKGLRETDVAAQLLSNFRLLYGVFTRATQEVAFKAQMSGNIPRVERTNEIGELVFREMPRPVKMPKHLPPPPATGHYLWITSPQGPVSF